jgi:hypothetical protein
VGKYRSLDPVLPVGPASRPHDLAGVPVEPVCPTALAEGLDDEQAAPVLGVRPGSLAYRCPLVSIPDLDEDVLVVSAEP